MFGEQCLPDSTASTIKFTAKEIMVCGLFSRNDFYKKGPLIFQQRKTFKRVKSVVLLNCVGKVWGWFCTRAQHKVYKEMNE